MTIQMRMEPVYGNFAGLEYIVFTVLGQSEAMTYGQEKKNDVFGDAMFLNKIMEDFQEMNDGNWPEFRGMIEIDGTQYNGDVNSFINKQTARLGIHIATHKNIDKTKIGLALYDQEKGYRMDSLENYESEFGISE